ncbi:MAG: DUF2283 domain-containing protein [Deltaproteobacteria bacterium]|nr:DUF2283 domain-containing protein [Deltaproteobacteria bacterium]
MRIVYDPKTDTLDMIFKEGKVAESDEDKPGLILDYDEAGNILSIEVLEASKKLKAPIGVSFEVATPLST